MTEKKVVLKNEYGLHARPASLLSKLASEYQSDVFIVKDEKEVSAKSVLNLLFIAAPTGTELLVRATGPDEEDAVKSIVNLIEVKKFNET